jgi:hypothetical protein
MADQHEHPVDIEALFESGDAIDKAIEKGAREARRFHKALGHSIPEWRDGRVVWIPPEDIVVDEDDE